METVETQAILIANEAWNDLEFEVALDSGAVIHVCSLSDCPGYELEESPGSNAQMHDNKWMKSTMK